MVRLELLKWRASIERILGSVANLERQNGVYHKRAEETGRFPSEVRLSEVLMHSGIRSGKDGEAENDARRGERVVRREAERERLASPV